MDDVEELSEEELGEVIGPHAMYVYRNAEEQTKRAIRKWAAGLRKMSDAAFFAECVKSIFDDEKLGKGFHSGIYVRTDACAYESERRDREAGHTENCLGDDIYRMAHKEVMREQGRTTHDLIPCTCGTRMRPDQKGSS
jgi:hypothetical protein